MTQQIVGEDPEKKHDRLSMLLYAKIRKAVLAAKGDAAHGQVRAVATIKDGRICKVAVVQDFEDI